jgi:hypothetical protein
MRLGFVLQLFWVCFVYVNIPLKIIIQCFAAFIAASVVLNAYFPSLAICS